MHTPRQARRRCETPSCASSPDLARQFESLVGRRRALVRGAFVFAPHLQNLIPVLRLARSIPLDLAIQALRESLGEPVAIVIGVERSNDPKAPLAQQPGRPVGQLDGI